jgi:hypothetical protein
MRYAHSRVHESTIGVRRDGCDLSGKYSLPRSSSGFTLSDERSIDLTHMPAVISSPNLGVNAAAAASILW